MKVMSESKQPLKKNLQNARAAAKRAQREQASALDALADVEENIQAVSKKAVRRVAAVVDPTTQMSGLIAFIRERAIVGLAVGFVIGTQVQSVVKQLSSSFIDPLFQLLFGKALSERTFTLRFHHRAAAFGWGAMAYALLDLFFVVAVIYLIVRLFSLDKLDKPQKK